jgi:hypothetical protein
LLLSLGFVHNPKIISDAPGGLSFDFASFELAAIHVINRSFQPVVQVSGLLGSAKTLTEMS